MDHPHLLTGLATVAGSPAGLDPGDGTRLDELASRTGPFTEEEVATVVVPVAQALGALHGAGLVHGQVSERCVVVRPDGMPLLVAQAPVPGDRGRRRDDLAALIDCAVRLLPDERVYAASGLGDDCLRAQLLALRGRPDLDAGALVDSCFRQVEPAPLRRPGPVAGAGTREREGRGADPADRTRSRQCAPDQGPGDPAGMAAGLLRTAAARDQRQPSGGLRGTLGATHTRRAGRRRSAPRRRGRWPAGARRGGALAVVLLVLGLTLVGVVHRVGSVRAGASGPSSTGQSPSTQAGEPDDPAAAAVELSRRRAELFADPATADLGRVEVVDGPAYLADRATLAAMGGVRNTGLQAQVHAASTVSIGADGTAHVQVTATQSGYVRTATDGSTTQVPQSGPRTVELELRWTDVGWRVWSVSEPSTP